MKSKQDLLDLLNYIKKSMNDELGIDNKFYSFTIKHINYYCNPNNTRHRFRQFKIKKKRPGEYRLITAPRNKNFQYLLACVNEILKSIYIPSDFATGFIEGKSIVTNAEVHLKKNYVLNIDLKDFFPSIKRARIYSRLLVKPFEFSEEIARIIAGLCTMKETHRSESGDLYNIYVLPQGSPTSPIITNMICDKLDRRLAGLAKRFGLSYTRYADDITFSSMHNVYHKNGTFMKELERIIQDQGFVINEGKTRLQNRASRQEVTGIIVNQKLNVTQKYVRNIRNLLYMWENYGYNVAYSCFLPKYKSEKGHIKKGNPDLANVISGKLLYLKMVKGPEDSVFQKLNSKFQKLYEKINDVGNKTEQGITYIETMPISNFERQFNTNVEIKWTERKDIEKANDEKKPHRYAIFMLNGESIKASVKINVTDEEEKDKEKLKISLCKDIKGKAFWLIHNKDFNPLEYTPTINLDELNNELDNLLNDV